jgi:hypothetical protein
MYKTPEKDARRIHRCSCPECHREPDGAVARQHQAINRIIARIDDRSRLLPDPGTLRLEARLRARSRVGPDDLVGCPGSRGWRFRGRNFGPSGNRPVGGVRWPVTRPLTISRSGARGGSTPFNRDEGATS